LIKDELLNILLAARDTTANLLTSVIYYLARNPNVYQKARAEVIEKSFGMEFGYDQLRECRYLKAVIDESLRLAPPVPNNSRYAFEEDILVVGDRRLYLPAKTTIVYSIIEMQTRKDLWGDDADKFDPDRWIDSRIQKMVSNPFQYQPFSAGPRICLGQHFAKNEVTYTISRILQNFSSISLDYGSQPSDSILPNGDIGRINALTASYTGGVHVRLIE